MNVNPAFHPQALRAKTPAPLCSQGERGVVGMPLDVATGRGVVPRFMDFDRPETRTCNETRTYNGVSGAELSEHAKDIHALCQAKPRREGAGLRAYARESAVMAAAVWAYIMIKNALEMLAAPLQSKSYRERRGVKPRRAVPKAPIFWVTRPPSAADWAARDIEAGYDIRGTSPIWVMRRVYAHRARRRRDLEPAIERAYRLGQQAAQAAEVSSVASSVSFSGSFPSSGAEFIGPPAPRHYKEVQDLHMVWPPVELPTSPKGCLPRVSDIIDASGVDVGAGIIDADTYARLSADTGAEIDTLVEGYNFAVEQFGEDGAFNYLRGLRDVEADFMDAYIEVCRAFLAKERAPP